MDQEIFEEIKKDYISQIKDNMTENGFLIPMITVFAETQTEDTPAIIHIPIPEEYMKNDETKENFLTNIVPDIFTNIKEQFVPYAVGWAVESWMRELPKKSDVIDYKKVSTKKEAVFISIETKDSQKLVYVFNIKREGKQVNLAGDLVDKITLEEDKSFHNIDGVGGKFSNLFSKFDDK